MNLNFYFYIFISNETFQSKKIDKKNQNKNET